MGYKITIDGPSAAGKGYLADALSKKLNILNIDTGAMYRALGLYFVEKNVDLAKEDEIIQALEEVNISFKNEGIFKVFLNGEDVSSKIRTEEVGMFASKISSFPIVRKFMVEKQRQCANNNSIVMEGRDIGSVVFPNADLKIFLTAEAEIRAHRRLKDLEAKGINTNFEEVLKEIKRRDDVDYNKPISPLVKTEDMVEIDSTNLDKEQVLNEALRLVEKRGLVNFENI